MSESPLDWKQEPARPVESEPSATYMAGQLGRGFLHHDRREREAALEAFAAVDALQFAHLDDDDAFRAAEGYVDALWEKDEIEDACRVDGDINPERLEAADWSAVEAAFERRAMVAGIDPQYATLTTDAWLQHKVGGTTGRR